MKRRHTAPFWVGFIAFSIISAFALPARAQSHAAASNEGVKAYGSKNAPIVMEVFSDYQCPSCRGLFEQTLKQLIPDYVASGKVYLIHRDFPLPQHKYSWKAARYANAAAHVGKFPQTEAALYDNQSSWETDGDVVKYIEPAVGATDMKAMQKLVDACKDDSGVAQPKQDEPEHHGCPLDEAIQRDVAMGIKIPVAATPTFVITYKGKSSTTSGQVSYAVLKQYFDYLVSH
jgi:protein-disulfide isomerase